MGGVTDPASADLVQSRMVTAPSEIESQDGKPATRPNLALSLGDVWMMHTINFEVEGRNRILVSACPGVLRL